MDNLDGGAGDFHVGSTTLSEVASILFRGHLGPAPTAEATPNGRRAGRLLTLGAEAHPASAGRACAASDHGCGGAQRRFATV